nr:DCC1-like thiol-disulfide oxidoreductase family protein [Oxynema sp. CENA135]
MSIGVFDLYYRLKIVTYIVIYDGNCNLCSNLVQLLESLDKGDRFRYIPMQDERSLQGLQITPEDCELGMILIDGDRLEKRWQGSDAAEEIGRLLPGGEGFVTAYRSLPGLKWTGDRLYEQVRDRRYTLFGKRSQTYRSPYPADCSTCRSDDL